MMQPECLSQTVGFQSRLVAKKHRTGYGSISWGSQPSQFKLGGPAQRTWLVSTLQVVALMLMITPAVCWSRITRS